MPRQHPIQLDTLHINIDGRWSVDDMATFLRDVNALYDIRHALYMEPELLRYVSRYGRPHRFRILEPWWDWYPGPLGPGLELSSIKYGSPGEVNLRGLGDVVKEVRKLLLDLINLKETRRKARLENDLREQDVQAKMLHNARDFLKLRDEMRAYELEDDGALAYITAAITGVQERTLRQIERGNIKAIGPSSADSADEDATKKE